MNFFTKEVKIALVAIVAIFVLFFGLQYLKGLTMFSSNDQYYVCFQDVSGLSPSSAVFANGYKVGAVERIDYDYASPDRVIAVIGLDRQLRIPKGTKAEIASDLLGNVKLELNFGPNPIDLMAVGDTLAGGLKKGAMGKAADMLPQLEAMLPKLDSILSSVNALLGDPALMNTLHSIDQMTANLTKTTAQLNTLSNQLSMQMPGMLSHANATLANTEQITRQISDMGLAETMAKVDATLANVERLTARLNSSEGTLGLLMTDPSLYHHLNATMRDADSLMIDFKAHPKRYIHFSVFGKKDK